MARALLAQFVALLRTGRDHARRGKDLARALGVDDRTLRALAREAITEGTLVLSGNAGYWIAGAEHEAEETVGRLRSQGQKMLGSAAEIERLAARQWGGQRTLPLDWEARHD